MKRLLLLSAAFAVCLLAADVTGTWKATTEGPNGTMERTFVLKADGEKLTGKTTSSMFGDSVIENGKIQGDELSFTITVKFQDNEMKLNYKGKVSGDRIKFVGEGANGMRLEWDARKVS